MVSRLCLVFACGLVGAIAGCSSCPGQETCFELGEIAAEHEAALAVEPPAAAQEDCTTSDDSSVPASDAEEGDLAGQASCEEEQMASEARLAEYHRQRSLVDAWDPSDGCPTAEQMAAIVSLSSGESRWFEEVQPGDGDMCCYLSGDFCD